MAGPTRLELATSGVTGRRSNQLNYDPARELTLAFFRPTRAIVSHASGHLGARPRALRDGDTNLACIIARGLGGTGLEPVTAGV
jgi:hypothetical protein